MKIQIRQTSPSTSEAAIRGHRVSIDRPTEKGGADAGPMGGELFLTAVGGVFIAFAPTLTAFFGHDPAVSRVAARALRVMSAGFPFYAFGMVVMQAFNGAGDTWTPTWLNFLIFWCWEIPLAWLLAEPVGWGATGAFVAIPIAFSTMAAVGAILFRRGKWRRQQV